MKKRNIILNIVVVLCTILLAVFAYNYSGKDTSPVVEKIVPPTARIDITTKPVESKPQFEVYLNNSKKPLAESVSMTKNYNIQGVVIQKKDGVVEMTIKPLKDAKIEISLRGIWDRSSDGKYVEHWVKYTALIINGENVMPTPVSVWYGKQFSHTIDAKVGEAYKIKVKWQKHEESAE